MELVLKVHLENADLAFLCHSMKTLEIDPVIHSAYRSCDTTYYLQWVASNHSWSKSSWDFRVETPTQGLLQRIQWICQPYNFKCFCSLCFQIYILSITFYWPDYQIIKNSHTPPNILGICLKWIFHNNRRIYIIECQYYNNDSW